MKKNVLSLALALALCLGLSTPAFAAEEPAGIHWLPDGINFDFQGSKESSGMNSQLFCINGFEGSDPSSTRIAVMQKTEEYQCKYGFVDATGKIVIPLEYDSVSTFSKGLAAVEKDGKWGYIDTTGKVAIPFAYDFADDFSEGLAKVWIGEGRVGKFGYIDTTGKFVIPCQYDDASSFSNGVAWVSIEGKGGFIDTIGNVVLPFEYSVIYDFYEGMAEIEIGDWKNRRCGFVDTSGNIVVPCEYDHTYKFCEGMAAVEKDGKWGFIDSTGKLVIPCEYDSVGIFSDGLASVQIGDWKTGKCGYIDKTGKVVVLIEYDGASDFSEGLARIQIGDGETEKYGYIDKTGKVVIPVEYDDASDFSEGLARVRIGDWETGKYGYIDKTGKVVIPFEYDWAYSFSNGAAIVSKDGKYGCIDKTGKVVIPFEYDDVMPLANGFTVVGKGGKLYSYEEEEDGKAGYVMGDKIIVPAMYDYVCFFGSYICVKENGRSGVYLNPYYSAGQPSIAYASTQTVQVDGKPVEFQAYALRDANGGDTNYIKLRDVACALNGTAAQFEVGWDGAVNIETGKPYTVTGTEMSTPFSGDRAYAVSTAETRINGQPTALDAIVLTDDNGGDYTYYKLRDLGAALGFTVDWSAEAGITIQTK